MADIKEMETLNIENDLHDLHGVGVIAGMACGLNREEVEALAQIFVKDTQKFNQSVLGLSNKLNFK